MSVFTIPNQAGQIRQVNDGEIFGELSESFNLDLSSSKGKIKVSKKLVSVLIEGTHIGTPAGFVDMLIWNGYYYILTEDSGYRCAVTNDPTVPANWSSSVATHDSELSTTAVIFDGRMRLALDTKIAEWDGSGTYDEDWWTVDIGGTALTANYPHILEVVQSQKETLYVTDKNFVRYVEKGGTPQDVELDSNVVACCLASGLSGAMWVGTYNETVGSAYVYEIYTGEAINSTPVYRQAYKIDANAVLAMWVHNNTPYILTSRGDVQGFNGVGFEKINEFPFKFSTRDLNGVQSGLIQASNRSRPVHPRGVRVHNNSAFININLRSEEDAYATNTRSHSGVWEFDHSTGQLNHRYAFSHYSTDFGSDVQGFAYPILIVDTPQTFLFAGGFDPTANKDNVYMTSPTAVSQGYFVTPEITSQSVADAYEAVYHKAKTMTSGEEIVTQYRTSKRDTVYATAVWTSTTTFSTTDDCSSVLEGELIRVSHGYSAGNYANVVSITDSGSTFEITVDRPIGLATNTSYVYSDNFKKDPTAYISTDGEFKRLGSYGTNPWIQFLIYLKGDVEYRQFICKGNSKNEL